MKYLRLMLVLGFALTISMAGYSQAKYIGANGCKMCHNKAYRVNRATDQAVCTKQLR